MSFLAGLHGALAIVLLLGLLFAEEAGVPLPFAPGELTLLAAGLLVASGGLNPFIFVPLAIVGCVAGSLVGYSWARLVGERGLRSLARRLRQEKALERVSARLRSAGAVGIGVSRLIPGLRIYTTLVAGAVRVPRRTFVAGMVPATIVWVVAFTVLGAVVGIPVERFLNSFQKLAVQGAILVAMGLAGYLAIRRTPASGGAGLVRVPRAVRVALAAAVDIGVVASITTGLFAVATRIAGGGLGTGWIEVAGAVAGVLIFYVVVARRGAGATVGESLLQTTYASGRGLPHRPADAWQAARALLARGSDRIDPTARLLRSLGDSLRLRLVRELLDRAGTAEELAVLTGEDTAEVALQLERLAEAGIVVAEAATGETSPATCRYAVRRDLAVPLVQFLAAAGRPVPAEAG